MILDRHQGVILQHPNMQKEVFIGTNIAGRLVEISLAFSACKVFGYRNITIFEYNWLLFHTDRLKIMNYKSPSKKHGEFSSNGRF